MITFSKKYGPGLLIVGLVALVSQFLAKNVIPNIGAVTLAILLGMLVSNLFIKGADYAAGYQFAEKKLLPVAIVLLGTELQLRVLIELGVETAVLILLIVLSTMLSSIFVGRLMGFSQPFSLLMGAGNAICGSSAIAAISPLVDSKEEEVGLSIGTVNLLGTIGIFFLPILVQLFRLDAISGGAVIGGSLQAIGQVVAAGYSVNDETGNIALLVKMGRVLMLGPLALAVTWRGTAVPPSGKRAVQIPPFIIGFLLVSILASWQIMPVPLVDGLKQAGKWLLLLAMAGIGLKIRLETILQQGPKTLLFGCAVATVQLTVAILIVYAIY
jgi:uncharacterized integral membrane protein (TIGR00698 family)